MLKTRIYLIIVLLAGTHSLIAQKGDVELPKAYTAYKTSETITIDGEAKEASWDKVPWSDDYIDIEGIKIPKYRTRMKMMWDQNNMYFFAELEEPHVWGNLKMRDTIIYVNNDFEIFIDPDGDSHNYYEFEMNALNTTWDLFLSKSYRERGFFLLNNMDLKGMKTAVYVDGTLNDPSDVDKKWTIEIAMSWKAINETYDNTMIAPNGKTWRINFSRVNWDFELINGVYHRKKDSITGKYLPPYNWVWTSQGVINMHEPPKWGYVYFSEKPCGEFEEFKYGKDELFKAKLHVLRKKLKLSFYKNRRENITVGPQSLLVDGQTVEVHVFESDEGYDVTAKSPFTGKTWRISRDGKFTHN
jgi:hypothetical protein